MHLLLLTAAMSSTYFIMPATVVQDCPYVSTCCCMRRCLCNCFGMGHVGCMSWKPHTKAHRLMVVCYYIGSRCCCMREFFGYCLTWAHSHLGTSTFMRTQTMDAAQLLTCLSLSCRLYLLLHA